MPRYNDIKRVLVIGSGPIIIGQAAEFDYAGTQACRELKKEGLNIEIVYVTPYLSLSQQRKINEMQKEKIQELSK